MKKLSNYSRQEIKAVRDYCLNRDSNYLPTEKDMLLYMNSLAGQQIILKLRLRKLGRDIIKSLIGSK